MIDSVLLFNEGLAGVGMLTRIAVILALGVGLAIGLLLILLGMLAVIKKRKAAERDITWSQIGLQVGAGSVMLGLAWMVVQVVSTTTPSG